jgi:hypothetical protein
MLQPAALVICVSRTSAPPSIRLTCLAAPAPKGPTDTGAAGARSSSSKAAARCQSAPHSRAQSKRPSCDSTGQNRRSFAGQRFAATTRASFAPTFPCPLPRHRRCKPVAQLKALRAPRGVPPSLDGFEREPDRLAGRGVSPRASRQLGDTRFELAIVGGCCQERRKDLKAQTCPSQPRTRRVVVRGHSPPRRRELGRGDARQPTPTAKTRAAPPSA